MSELGKVTVIDYGVGNLFSVAQAFQRIGAEVELTDSAEGISRADKLVLPGVGAFADGMEGLRRLDLISPIQDYAAANRPLLGICLGMQMLLTVSEEFGSHPGLGIVPGRVQAIPAETADGKKHKIPHIGWNALVPPQTSSFAQNPYMAEIPEGTAFYFVHTYTAVPELESHRLADCYYDGFRVSAVIASGPVIGCQFHPEKSGNYGLVFLKQFMRNGLETGSTPRISQTMSGR